MERKNYIVAVDLGSSSVRVAVGEKTDGGLMEIACVVSKPVEGVRAGKIENIELVSQAVCEAFGEVEEQLGIHITEAYAGISGDFVRCARHTDHVFVYDPQNGVNQKDVDALFDRMRNVQAPDDETIMERVPQNYAVDDDREVRNPVGSFGKKLSSTFNFILCQRTPMQRLEMALKRLGIRTLGIIPDALATPESVLLPDEKEEGIAVVDVGAGVTDVTVYYRNVVRYVVSIPMGASAINRDIRTLSVPEKHVESLKRKYGSAVAELASDEKLIRVNGRTAREAKDILLRNLATVIEARATPETGLTEASKERVADPACATVVGLLLRGAAQGGCAFIETHVPTPSPAPSPRPTPTPAPSPRPMPTPTPAPAPSPASDPEEPEIEESESTAPRRKRDWGSILQKTFDKINKSFSAAEDEEI